MATKPTMGSALAASLRADNDEDRAKAAQDLATAQDELVAEADKLGCKLTFGVQVPPPAAPQELNNPQPEVGG